MNQKQHIEVERRHNKLLTLPSCAEPVSEAFIYDVYRLVGAEYMERMRIKLMLKPHVRLYREFTGKSAVYGEFEETTLPADPRYLFRQPAAVVFGIRKKLRLPGIDGIVYCQDRIWGYTPQGGFKDMGSWTEVEKKVRSPDEVHAAKKEVESAFDIILGVRPEKLVKEPYPVLLLNGQAGYNAASSASAFSKADSGEAPRQLQ